MPRRKKGAPPEEVREILGALEEALNKEDGSGRRVGDAKCGIYAFFDYDGEPIYVGQTSEKLRVRIRRHLTNQRTDAVAMKVLDPFEVADLEMWPFWDLEDASKAAIKLKLNSAEYTLYQELRRQSAFLAILNEKPVEPAPLVQLPASIRTRIVPDAIYERRVHPDLRVARRADTIARLAQVISEREVQVGLRQTLLTQAQRLEHLAKRRLAEVGDPSSLDTSEKAK